MKKLLLAAIVLLAGAGCSAKTSGSIDIQPPPTSVEIDASAY